MLNPSKTNGFSTFLSNGASRATFALTSNRFNNVCALARATIFCKKGHAGHMRAAAALLREVSEIGGAPGIAFQSYEFDGFNWRSGAWRLLSPFGDHTKGILWKALQRDSIGPRLVLDIPEQGGAQFCILARRLVPGGLRNRRGARNCIPIL